MNLSHFNVHYTTKTNLINGQIHSHRLIYIDISCVVLFLLPSTRYPIPLLCQLTVTFDSFIKILYCITARLNKKQISIWEILEEMQKQVLLLL